MAESYILVEVLHLLAITEDQMASAQTSYVVSARMVLHGKLVFDQFK